MLFSYGFIEPDVHEASALSLDLDIPSDDPLKKAKEAVMTVAAAVRILVRDGSVTWESSAVWLSCVNEEDGLRFQLLQTIAGDRELRAFWKEHDITEDSGVLATCLEADPLWPMFQLRALTIVRERVEVQLDRLRTSQNSLRHSSCGEVRSHVLELSSRLCELESRLLERAYREFETQVGCVT